MLNSPQVEQPFFQSFLYGCISFHIYLYFFITIESSFWKFSKRINMHFLVKTNCPFRNSTKLKSHLYDNLCLTYIRYKYHLEHHQTKVHRRFVKEWRHSPSYSVLYIANADSIICFLLFFSPTFSNNRYKQYMWPPISQGSIMAL